jgi:hypothetical protein
VGLPRNLFVPLIIESRNFNLCRVFERAEVDFDAEDKPALLKQMENLIRDIDRRWVGGSYYSDVNFRAYHAVFKYVRSLQFAPCPSDSSRRAVRIEVAYPASVKTKPAAPGRIAA